MLVLAEVGFFTTLLEAAATSIGAGIVVGGFVVASVGMRTGRSRRKWTGMHREMYSGEEF